jgi:hypothetical protein
MIIFPKGLLRFLFELAPLCSCDFGAFVPHHMWVKAKVGHRKLMLRYNTLARDHLAIQTSPCIHSSSEDKVNLARVLGTKGH